MIKVKAMDWKEPKKSFHHPCVVVCGSCILLTVNTDGPSDYSTDEIDAVVLYGDSRWKIGQYITRLNLEECRLYSATIEISNQ